MFFAETYYWDKPCWNTQWVGLAQSVLDPLDQLSRGTTGIGTQTTLEKDFTWKDFPPEVVWYSFSFLFFFEFIFYLLSA